MCICQYIFKAIESPAWLLTFLPNGYVHEIVNLLKRRKKSCCYLTTVLHIPILHEKQNPSVSASRNELNISTDGSRNYSIFEISLSQKSWRENISCGCASSNAGAEYPDYCSLLDALLIIHDVWSKPMKGTIFKCYVQNNVEYNKLQRQMILMKKTTRSVWTRAIDYQLPLTNENFEQYAGVDVVGSIVKNHQMKTKC